jgi:serine/threonine protein kinase
LNDNRTNRFHCLLYAREDGSWGHYGTNTSFSLSTRLWTRRRRGVLSSWRLVPHSLFVLSIWYHVFPDTARTITLASTHIQFCGGGDLGKILDRYRHRGKSIPEHIVWNYFIQLTQALHHCHHPEDRHLPSSSSYASPSRTSTSPDNATGIPGSSFERKSSIVPGREMGLRRKLDSLDISPGGGDPLGLGLGGGAARRRMDVKASAAGQVLHRDLKPENSECCYSCFT